MSENFRKVMFNESKFLIGISVLDTKYEHLESQKNNLFYPFNDQFNYVLANNFAESEIIKCNVDKFPSNLLMKLRTKKLLYCNADK